MNVRVWNDNTKVYSEELDGEVITIPAKGFVEMSRGKGMKLVQSFTPVLKDGMGNHLNPKMLRVEFHEGRYKQVLKEEEKNRSMLTGQMYPSAAELENHILANAEKLTDPSAVKKGK